MLISLNWIRDFVDLPANLDPYQLGERFTVTTAEVEAVRPVNVCAKGLIAARVMGVKPIPDSMNIFHVTLDTGTTATVETVTSAQELSEGAAVVYAPPGASVATITDIGTTTVAGRPSVGMILPGEAVGVPMAAREAILLGAELEPGQPLPAPLFDDWVLEIDNKSLTHRPDLWGHYGIAREIAAMIGCPLKEYDVVAAADLANDNTLAPIDITIDDPRVCRRYTGLVIQNVPTRPAALWMQLRLGHVGLRPIHGLVDLTNYVMTDLGQPMHAFDGDKVQRIEVNWARPGETFYTLDGVPRKLVDSDLMIQCAGKSIALAGVMGGRDTEVTPSTKSLLLESANFDPATIRRTASRLGLRTEASARFEKSLDPAHTVLALQRFMRLARDIYPSMTQASQLSDRYPAPKGQCTVLVNPRQVARILGREVTRKEAVKVLTPLEFSVTDQGEKWQVAVPSFRATNDVSIEADVIEELARYLGYDSIKPVMPRVTMRRFEPNALHELEQKTLAHWTATQGFREIHSYNWYDRDWLTQLGIEPGPCIELKNAAAAGLEKLRRSLIPGLLASVARNRFYFEELSIVELGSVFEPATPTDREYRHVGLIRAKRGKKAEKQLFDELKGAMMDWAYSTLTATVDFSECDPSQSPAWADVHRTASVRIDGESVGFAGVLPLALRRRMDEHLQAWSIAWAELRLSGLESRPARTESLGRIPRYPLAEIDFTFTVPATMHFTEVRDKLHTFNHLLLKEMRFLSSYEGAPIAEDRRALTVRMVVGCADRTLVDDDMNSFRQQFEQNMEQLGFQRR